MRRRAGVAPETAEVADRAARALTLVQRKARKSGTVTIQPVRTGKAPPIVLPVEALLRLVEILRQMAAGREVAVVPRRTELTTHQAARLLNVSRPYLISLLDAGKIRCRRVGTHRRINIADLIEYRKEEDEIAEDALTELAAEAQRLSLGY